MAAQVGALRVTVGADITGLQTGMRRAQRQVQQSASVMQKSVAGVQSSFKGLAATIGISLGTAGVLLGARAFLRVADAAKSLQAQLRLATQEYGNFAQANKDVQRIAATTRAGLVETANLYAVFQRNAKELGITQEQSARATETVNKTFQISGASAAEAAGGLRQFLQALQSGQLRGEEFNSVMENAPRLARLLADSLGVTIGQLRAMAKEGEITGDKLVAALTDRKFTDQIDAEFRQLPVTFDQAMGQIHNAAIVAFGAFDRGGQFSTALANFITDGTGGFADLEGAAERFGIEVRATMAGLQDVFEPMLMGAKSVFGQIRSEAQGLKAAIADILGTFDAFTNSFANFFNAPGNLLRKGIGYKPIVNPVQTRSTFLAGARKSEFEAARRRIMSPEAFQASAAELGLKGRAPPPFVAPPGKEKKGGGKKSSAPRDRSEDVSFQFEQELRQAQADVLRAQQSMVATNEERARIALLLLDAERQGKEAELKDRVRRAERDLAEGKITASTLEQVKVQADKLRAEYDSVDALERKAIADDLVAQKAEDAAQLIDTDYGLQLEKLELEASLKETAAERREVELRILALAKEQEKARLLAVLAEKKTAENALAQAQAQQRLNELDSIYAGRASVVEQGTRGPMEDYLASLPTTAAKAQEALERLQVQGFEGLIDAALELSNGFDSAAESLLNTLKSFFLGMARLELQKGLGSLLQSSGIFGSVTGAISESGASFFGGADASFAHGGSFNIKGRPGIDRNMLSLNGIPIANVSYGERVSVSNDNMRGAPQRRGDINFNFPNSDFDSFRRNSSQAARLAKRKLGI